MVNRYSSSLASHPSSIPAATPPTAPYSSLKNDVGPVAVSPQNPSSSSPAKTATASPFPDLAPPSPLPILIRATDGKSKEHRKDKIKISTIVQPDELEGFFTKYTEVMKGGTTGLKKRDRSGRKKATKAKKKGKGGGSGAGEGDGEKK
ncbi:MAG: hypothetical protein Q9182_002411 [Xanthomendoza sp. 2 TL-2023]